MINYHHFWAVHKIVLRGRESVCLWSRLFISSEVWYLIRPCWHTVLEDNRRRYTDCTPLLLSASTRSLRLHTTHSSYSDEPLSQFRNSKPPLFNTLRCVWCTQVLANRLFLICRSKKWWNELKKNKKTTILRNQKKISEHGNHSQFFFKTRLLFIYRRQTTQEGYANLTAFYPVTLTLTLT